ncbi:hypothetical protein MMPV_000415 [Pyropia vietnamensis]
MSAASRPLASDVSVFTDGTYEVVPGTTPPEGCPTSLLITGELSTGNNSFFLSASRVTINGAACTGATAEAGLLGLYGPPLSEAAKAANLTDPIPLDAKAAAVIGSAGPLTCGDKTWAGDEIGFVFLIENGQPVAFYFDAAFPERECKMPLASGATSSFAKSAPA